LKIPLNEECSPDLINITEKNCDSVNKVPVSQCDHNIRLVYLNARSIVNKIYDVQSYLAGLSNPDVVIITESWLRNEQKQFFNFPCYTSYFVCKKEKRGGSVGKLVKSSLVSEMTYKYSSGLD